MRIDPKVAVLVLLIATVLILFGSPFVIGYIYNVPAWFLFPKLFEMSSASLEGKMNVTVAPTVPAFLGDPVDVYVIDAQNGSSVEWATVQISRDGTDYSPILTDSNGKATFEYPGEPTIIRISKEKYETVTKVIPRIPDQWIRADFAQLVVSIATLIVSAISTIATVAKFREEFKINKKRKRK